jgi:flagellar basal body-associated protein FliL
MVMAGPSDEVPLEDIDRILAEEDPEFAKSLEEVRAVEVDKNVVIVASAIDESEEPSESNNSEGQPSFIKRKIAQFRQAIVSFRLRLKARFVQAAKDFLLFLKTRPKEFAFYSFAMSKRLLKAAKKPLQAFAEAPRIFQLSLLVAIFLTVGSLWVLVANLKGIWIPHLTEPILASLEPQADFVETYDPKDGAESFYSAFPQELHEFLFKKMKVNLRRTSMNPNPMGAFEIVVDVDSKDSAVELRDREVELHDLLQRLFEDELASDLETEPGKKILKGRIRKELNAKLTQGWIKDVHFKSFVLKP